MRRDDSARDVRAAVPRPLTGRQLEVMLLLVAGKTNQEIADALSISPNTVIRHVSNIYRRVGAKNRAEAVSYAYRNRLVD